MNNFLTYLKNLYFLFLKDTFFKNRFNPRYSTITSEYNISFIIKIAMLIYLVYNQYALLSLCFVFGFIVIPYHVEKFMKNHNYFFKLFINHLNYSFKTNEFGINDELGGYITYKNKVLYLNEGLYKPVSTVIIESRWASEEHDKEIEIPFRDNSVVRMQNTIRFNLCKPSDYNKIMPLISNYMMNDNPAKSILNKIKN